MKAIRLLVVLALLSFLLEVSLGGTAEARTRRYSSTISTSFHDPEQVYATGNPLCIAFPDECFDLTDTFDGAVGATKAACRNRRHVAIYRHPSGSPVELVGRGTTDSTGYYAVNAEDPGNGTYSAHVAQRRLSPTSVCRGADTGQQIVANDTQGL